MKPVAGDADTLPVSGPAGAFDVVLALSDGTPLVVTARPGGEAQTGVRADGISNT